MYTYTLIFIHKCILIHTYIHKKEKCVNIYHKRLLLVRESVKPVHQKAELLQLDSSIFGNQWVKMTLDIKNMDIMTCKTVLTRFDFDDTVSSYHPSHCVLKTDRGLNRIFSSSAGTIIHFVTLPRVTGKFLNFH